MARSYGSSSTLLALKEPAYGTPPSGDFEKYAFVSSDVSAEQPLLASDLLGQGREPRAPFRDVITDTGNLVVPVECRDFGRWLEFLLGAPTSSANAANGNIVFTANPSNGHTITLNGVAWSFVNTTPTGNQTEIQGSLGATLSELVSNLNASVVSGLSVATYSTNATTLTVTHDTAGATGNSYTLASNNANGVVSGAHLSGGGYTHIYESGAAALPSFALEVGHANVPAYFLHTGCLLGSMAFNFQRSGAANATLNVIAQGETRYGSSQGGTPTRRAFKPFSQFNGAITRNGVALANVTAAQFTYSNGLETIPTLRNDALIEGVDPTILSATGSIDVRFADTTLIDDAINDTPIELELAYRLGGLEGDHFSLVWTFHEVYLPRPRVPISGPGGVQTTFNWQAVFSELLEKSVTVTLKNDVASYA
ncbi:MAG: hypothetical protein DI582_10215 [Azospirillum brasilense]|nr:MAG: hypothetical protein DI582_10215 [Azospirillum brasilense]